MKAIFRIGALAALLALPGSAAVIISNLPISLGSYNSQFANADNLAAGFAMPGGSNYALDSITLQLTLFAAFTSVDVSLYGGSSSAPSGASLVTFPTSSLSANGTTTPYTFLPPSPFTLLASTNYWIVLEGEGSTQNAVTWDGSSPAVTATGLATFLGQTSGASLPPTTPVTSAARFSFQVDGTLEGAGNVPEPATFGLVAACLAILAQRSVFRKVG